MLFVFAFSWFAQHYVLGFAAVKGDGMLPLLGKNNQVFVMKLFKNASALSRGDIVIFTDKNNNDNTVRLIGLPGEKVEIKNGLTFINGKPIYEPYAHTPLTYEMAPVIVPKNNIFVLNDNRSDQKDSREYGSVPFEWLKGRAVFCYWPWTKIQVL
ncbi:MAG: signal peptidase I [Peptococcaceae bacterium]|nr:signal peptidase I [Peptococcaceae bacterium]